MEGKIDLRAKTITNNNIDNNKYVQCKACANVWATFIQSNNQCSRLNLTDFFLLLILSSNFFLIHCSVYDAFASSRNVIRFFFCSSFECDDDGVATDDEANIKMQKYNNKMSEMSEIQKFSWNYERKCLIVSDGEKKIAIDIYRIAVCLVRVFACWLYNKGLMLDWHWHRRKYVAQLRGQRNERSDAWQRRWLLTKWMALQLYMQDLCGRVHLFLSVNLNFFFGHMEIRGGSYGNGNAGW